MDFSAERFDELQHLDRSGVARGDPARQIVPIRPSIVAAGSQILIQPDERSVAHMSSQRRLCSSCEPSTQWMDSGFVRLAIFSTHLRRCSLWLRGAETLWLFSVIAILDMRSGVLLADHGFLNILYFEYTISI